MNARIRKLNLTAHVVTSVGWLGAVVAFLALSIIGLRSGDQRIVQACYVSMNLIGLAAIVPLSALTSITGIAQSVVTHWGLSRYYWVLTKLILTLGATALLLLHQFTAVAAASRRALSAVPPGTSGIGSNGTQLVFDAALAIAALLLVTALSIYKPWGMTPWAIGADEMLDRRLGGTTQRSTPLGVRVFYTALGLLLVAVVILHLLGHGMPHHGM